MAGSTSKAWFFTDTEEYANMQVTDPVCGMAIDSDKAVAKEVWQEQAYYLCSASCHEKFRAAPERYAKKAADTGTRPKR